MFVSSGGIFKIYEMYNEIHDTLIFLDENLTWKNLKQSNIFFFATFNYLFLHEAYATKFQFVD